MINVLVTGGAGYIGTHLYVSLLKAGFSPIIYDNFSNSRTEVLEMLAKTVGFKPAFVKGDIRDVEKLRKVLEEKKIETVFHLAGLKSVSESIIKPELYYNVNVCGTKSLIEAMRLSGVRELVFSSSAVVYGKPKYLPIDENHPTNPLNPYGSSKLLVEQMLSELCCDDKEWKIICLRYFNPIGSHPDGLLGDYPKGIPDNLLPYLAQVAIGKLPELKIFGGDYDTIDGTGVRDYLHILDLVEAHILAAKLLKNMQGIEYINLGTGGGVSVFEILDVFEKVIGRKISYKVVDRRVGDIDSCYTSAEKAKIKLSWQSKRTLREMCESSWYFQSKLK